MIMLEIVAVWFALSLLSTISFCAIRTHQKRRAELRARIDRIAALDEFQMEQARHHHVVCEYRRLGAL